ESYTLPLRGALHVVYGGCSDDHFEAFRGWLLTRGRPTFERVLAEPDSLVDVLVEGEMAESEQMLYVGALAIEALTGEFPEGPAFVGEAGEGEFDPTDATEQQRRYPRLWAKYAHMPRPRDALPEED
ncbi:MAG TPA: DUF4240 domain-containing protein, partial [Polyangiaceae bacterium]|nr:DUF4240 domain-containing protein [Polyangiaceae bacterium]